MKCIVCGERIEEGEDLLIVDTDGDFMHKRCKPMWKRFKDRINKMTDAEFRRYFLGESSIESEE